MSLYTAGTGTGAILAEADYTHIQKKIFLNESWK